MLQVKNLKVLVENKEILKGINLELKSGELHVVMGPNGSGKSTLAQTIMGHPRYKVNGGKLIVNGKNITKLSPDKRAKLGLFLGFQHPVEIPGVKVYQFLRSAQKALKPDKKAKKIKPGEIKEFVSFAKNQLEEVGMSDSFLERNLNEGFSGGEKKRSEVFQMTMLEPKIAVLDEPDSGLDVDGLRTIAKKINQIQKKGTAVILISHNPRLLHYLNPDKIHIIKNGVIVKTGSKKLALEIEKKGFES